MPRLTEIRAPFRGSRKRLISVDDEPWCTTSAAVVKALGLTVESTITCDDLAEQIACTELDACRERALGLLNYRDHGKGELQRKLADDGYSDATIDSTIEALVRVGFIDDKRYAVNVVRSLGHAKAYGRSRVLRELRHRRVDDALAEAVIDELLPEHEEHERALGVARSLARRHTDTQRLGSALVRRGFSPSDAFAAARSVLTDAEDPTDSI